MNSLAEKFTQNILLGLDRKRLCVPSIWAEKIRVMGAPFPGPYDFKWTPWCKEMLDTDHPECVGQKSAQAGFTETMLNRALFTIDQLKRNVLYVLPNQKPDASEFTSSRFDPALEMSEHLASMFTKGDSVGHKRSGGASLFIRGARSRAQLKSLPVSLLIKDEMDEMLEEMIPLMLERLSGQVHKQDWSISTPSIPGFGINKQYELSSKEIFLFECYHCNKLTSLVFPECIEIVCDDETDPRVHDSFYKCKECHHEITAEEKHHALQSGHWFATEGNKIIRGFHVNQMYSYTMNAGEFALAKLRGDTKIEYEQEFHNSKLGVPHIVSGANLSLHDIDACIADYNAPLPTEGLVTMGVDVGKKLHIEIRQWKIGANPNSMGINDNAVSKVLAALTLDSFTSGFPELDPIISAYRPHCGIIDAHPEKTSSTEVCQRHPGQFYMCYYSTGAKAANVIINNAEQTVSVDRTRWLDMAQGRFRNRTVHIPKNTTLEYKNNQMAPVRVYKKDVTGHDVSMYVNTKPDHFAHTSAYCEIGLKVAQSLSAVAQNVESPI